MKSARGIGGMRGRGGDANFVCFFSAALRHRPEFRALLWSVFSGQMLGAYLGVMLGGFGGS